MLLWRLSKNSITFDHGLALLLLDALSTLGIVQQVFKNLLFCQ